VAGNRHFPAFERLCDRAAKRGLQVRLHVGEPVQFARRRGEYFRQLTDIVLWSAHTTTRRAPIYDEDLEAAALELLGRL